jgi:hypothetical protein
MAKINYNTMRVNMPQLSKEFDNWNKWVRSDIPGLKNIDLRILCTYVEAFSVPFLLNEKFLISYGSPNQSIVLRDEVHAQIRSEYIESEFLRTTQSLHSFITDNPGAFKIIPRALSRQFGKVRVQYNYTPKDSRNWIQKIFTSAPKTVYLTANYDFTSGNKLNIGYTTGRSYVDIYGFVWLEMLGYFQEKQEQTLCWVRLLAVDMDNREHWDAILKQKRDQIMHEREDSEHRQENVKKSLPFLSAGALFLMSSNI